MGLIDSSPLPDIISKSKICKWEHSFIVNTCNINSVCLSCKCIV